MAHQQWEEPKEGEVELEVFAEVSAEVTKVQHAAELWRLQQLGETRQLLLRQLQQLLVRI